MVNLVSMDELAGEISLRELLKENVVRAIDYSHDISEEETRQIIENEIYKISRERYISINEKNSLAKEIFSSLKGLDLLDRLLEDDEITEVMINGPGSVFVERQGKITKTDFEFESEEKLLDLIQRIAGIANRTVNEANPICDARLKDGSRANIILPPVAINGPILTIRKFSKKNYDIGQLISNQTLTEEAAEFLTELVKQRKNIFISGGTGSGKTTLLNALSGIIPPDERVITIEDSAELKLQDIPNLVRLEARSGVMTNPVSIRDLIKTALRARPDRIIVGEVRGVEAIDMIQAMNTGHDGSLSTGHANSPSDMLSRLETMILLDSEIPLMAVRKQIASAIDIMLHVSRMPDGSRKVVEIDEVVGMKGNDIRLRKLFDFSTEKGELVGCRNAKE